VKFFGDLRDRSGDDGQVEGAQEDAHDQRDDGGGHLPWCHIAGGILGMIVLDGQSVAADSCVYQYSYCGRP
jgi:hypothetical protein